MYYCYGEFFDGIKYVSMDEYTTQKSSFCKLVLDLPVLFSLSMYWMQRLNELSVLSIFVDACKTVCFISP